MRVLLTGANGFIGGYLHAALRESGHQVVAAIRRPQAAKLFGTETVAIDFNRDTRAEVWLPRLHGIDAVINCAGILQGTASQSIAAIHANAPIALFKACEIAEVERVIQISAISADANTEYARTKREADAFLASTELGWIVLRPSLVYAPGAYGGTALFRALAALPFAIPLIGKGDQPFQPIFIDDLCAIILKILATPALRAQTITPVGPTVVTLKEILSDLRLWLGLPLARFVHIPMPLVHVVSRLGDIVGGTINTTALRQLEHGNTGSYEATKAATGLDMRSWHAGLRAMPAQTQDRWHAHLYFLRPLLRWLIAFVWIASGLIGLLSRSALIGQFAAFGLALSPPAIGATCLLDIALGIAVFSRWHVPLIATVQLLVVAGYTLTLTIAAPDLWLEPLGPLLKNIPFILSVLVLAALERER